MKRAYIIIVVAVALVICLYALGLFSPLDSVIPRFPSTSCVQDSDCRLINPVASCSECGDNGCGFLSPDIAANDKYVPFCFYKGILHRTFSCPMIGCIPVMTNTTETTRYGAQCIDSVCHKAFTTFFINGTNTTEVMS